MNQLVKSTTMLCALGLGLLVGSAIGDVSAVRVVGQAEAAGIRGSACVCIIQMPKDWCTTNGCSPQDSNRKQSGGASMVIANYACLTGESCTYPEPVSSCSGS